VPVETAPQTELEAALRARVAELEAVVSSMTTELKTVRAERDKLRRAYEQLKAHLELLRGAGSSSRRRSGSTPRSWRWSSRRRPPS